jgi:hypothetical protein
MRIVRKKQAWLGLALCCVAGCSNDSAQSLSRDYRNISNECIDALMMVTGESRAKFANDRVLKPFADRIGKVDNRTQLYEQNTDDKVVMLQMVDTESVAILVAEGQINRTRFKLEQDRIKNLLGTLVGNEVEKRKAEGEANPIVKASEKWPNLNDIAMGSSTAKLREYLDKGPMLTKLFEKFGTKAWDKARPKNWDVLNTAFLDKVKKFDKLD